MCCSFGCKNKKDLIIIHFIQIILLIKFRKTKKHNLDLLFKEKGWMRNLFPADILSSLLASDWLVVRSATHLSLKPSGSIRRTPSWLAVPHWLPAARRRGCPSPNRSDPPCCRPTWTVYHFLWQQQRQRSFPRSTKRPGHGKAREEKRKTVYFYKISFTLEGHYFIVLGIYPIIGFVKLVKIQIIDKI